MSLYVLVSDSTAESRPAAKKKKKQKAQKLQLAYKVATLVEMKKDIEKLYSKNETKIASICNGLSISERKAHLLKAWPELPDTKESKTVFRNGTLINVEKGHYLMPEVNLEDICEGTRYLDLLQFYGNSTLTDVCIADIASIRRNPFIKGYYNAAILTGIPGYDEKKENIFKIALTINPTDLPFGLEFPIKPDSPVEATQKLEELVQKHVACSRYEEKLVTERQKYTFDMLLGLFRFYDEEK